MDADVEAFPRQGSYYRGHAGIRRWWGELLDVFQDFAIEIVDVRVLGDTSLAVLRFLGHGADNESPFDETVWHVWNRGGKSVWWRGYDTEDEALEAVGRKRGGGR
jgi:SnoaL-like domain